MSSVVIDVSVHGEFPLASLMTTGNFARAAPIATVPVNFLASMTGAWTVGATALLAATASTAVEESAAGDAVMVAEFAGESPGVLLTLPLPPPHAVRTSTHAIATEEIFFIL